MASLASGFRNPLEADPRDFSLVLGGPLYQLLRRAHITGDALELVRRRIVVITGFAWLPLALLALVDGDLLGRVAVPFVKDIQVHVRFLVAMPLLILAELVVHKRMRPIALEFLTRGLVPEAATNRFRECVASAMRVRNSVWAEIIMLIVIYAVGVPIIWREVGAIDVDTWYANASAHGAQLTLAGHWYAYVSVPVFQFLILRWYFRMVIWMRFLWQVSRISLNVSPMHADRMGGLGFLSATFFGFIPLAMAHGALLAGTIANRVFYAGSTLMDARFEIAIVVALILVLVFAPLTVFLPQVMAAKQQAARIYGRLAQRYVRDFETTWLPAGLPAPESPLGSGDIQSLADLANSFETMRATRNVPITREAVVMVAGATLLPVAPLLLTVVPAEEIAKHLLKLVL